jgi:hypothetical protein
MKRSRFILLAILAVLVFLSACNLPIEKRIPEPVLLTPMVSVKSATEIRSGPGDEFKLIGIIEPDQKAALIGQTPEGDYWIIQYLDNPQIAGWISSKSAIVSGDTKIVPIVTLSAEVQLTEIVLTQVVFQSPTPAPPTPVITEVEFAAGCPTPIGGGPTPVSINGSCGSPAVGSGCPTPIGGGPTPVSINGSCVSPAVSSGCPTPIGGGPTPVSINGSCGLPVVGSGCPTPIGGGPTPVSCSGSGGSTAVGSGCPTPIGGGPTPVSCSGSNKPLQPLRRTTLVPTQVQ